MLEPEVTFQPRAFKRCDAPATNLSENFHSTYTVTKQIRLSSLDAAYYHILYAIKLVASIDLFGKGIDCQGSGPSQKVKNKEIIRERERNKKLKRVQVQFLTKNIRTQAFLIMSIPNVSNNIPNDSSSNEGCMSQKKRKVEKRSERRRSSNTKYFKESLARAEKEVFNVHLLTEVAFNAALFKVRSNYGNFKVDVKMSAPFCSYNWFNKRKWSKTGCKRIIWMVVKLFKLTRYSDILPKNKIYFKIINLR